MQAILSIITIFLFTTGCQSSGSSNKITVEALPQKSLIDSTKPEKIKPYDELKYKDKEVLVSAPGTKSVLFNSSGSKLYAMNLEGMSVYEFNRESKKISREFKFTPTRGMGWDYARSRPIASFQEKPVEACLSHDDKILWVSLHNAEGLVPIWVDDISKNTGTISKEQKTKPVTVIYPETNKRDSFRVPLIETGKTPKVIARTTDSKHLLVSNWHSRNVSVLEMDDKVYPFGKIISTVPVSAIPRGIAVDDGNKKSYIAIMGGSSLAVIDNNTWKADTVLNVWSSPRHIVMDPSGHIFVSYNSLATIACLDAKTGKSLFTASTHSQPRTIVLSKNYKFIFVTCYTSDYVDVYKINADNFEKIASLPCPGHPVGVDVFEDNNKLEAWVCSYSGSITVFTFKKKD
ncbi:MAG: YncE family protein [Sphingobacteriales bacterium]|nr:YncE family protein [Sphingobacteriales bacterium]